MNDFLPRNNQWLKEKFIYLWKRYFSDIDIKNNIIIKFGRPCKTRLGSIRPKSRFDKSTSIITINGHFQNPEIPEFVVEAVIAHEFMHYAHGFASPHKQAYKHPHKGGVVTWDLRERGLDDILKLERIWIKKNWPNFIKTNHPYKARKRKFKRTIRWI